MSTETELRGKTAIVTGASSGIGRAIAEQLGARGAHVVLCGREKTAMQESVAKISASGGSASIVTADIRDPAALQSIVTDAVANHGQVDIFVNNAGVSYLGTVLAGTPDAWRNMLETNVLALLVGCQAAVAAMREKGNSGHIVNVSSVAALDPQSGVYGATKHAVNVITNTLREELLEDPIKLTSIMPGLVATNIGRNVDAAIMDGFVAMSGIQANFVPGERLPDDVIVGTQAALHDFMIRPEDIAAAVVFAVTQPADVVISEIVVRPNKQIALG